jgi:hypothetical protein
MYQKTYDALKSVVDYLYHDEEKHWKEAGRPKNHIFRDVFQLNGLLDIYSNEFDDEA